MWSGRRGAQGSISSELAELGRWAGRLAARVDVVTKEAAVLRAEAGENARSLEALCRR